MATAAVAHAPVVYLVRGEDTKNLECDDPFARLILPDFIDLVDPRHLIMYLPHDLLTPADEDRVVTRQNSMGREDAARLLLALVSQRGDWIPRLMEGLRHRQIRLEHLADRIDHLRAEVPMEIDFDENDRMEVDSEPWYEVEGTETRAPGHPHSSGDHQGNIVQQQTSVRQYILQIAHRFFMELANSVEDVKILTEQLERIATAITSSYAFSCLALRLRMSAPCHVREFRRLVESGALQKTVESVLLTGQRREKLEAMVAEKGLELRQLKLKVTVRKEDLDRCEAFLATREEMTIPTSPGEALVLKAAQATVTAVTGSLPLPVRHKLPALLLAFLDNMLQNQPLLADKVGPILASSPLKIGIIEMMERCREFFGLSNEHEKDLAFVVMEMLRTVHEDSDEEGEGEMTYAPMSFSDSHIQAVEAPLSPDVSSDLFIEAPPDSLLGEVLKRLEEAQLMAPCHVANRKNTFCFRDSFVADYALSCTAISSLVPPTGYVSRALGYGSSFAMLHFVDLLLNLSLSRELTESRVTAEKFGRSKTPSPETDKMRESCFQQLILTVSGNYYPLAVTEMFLAIAEVQDAKFLSQRAWWAFGPQWKKQFQRLLASGKDIPDLSLCPLSSAEEDFAFAETMRTVISSRQTIDLSDKLKNLNSSQLRVILACAQLTNVASFELSGNWSLRVTQKKSTETSGPRTQPALKLCLNSLESIHIHCLIHALPGLESVSHYDLTECTLSRDSLQRFLNSLHTETVRTLILSKISVESRGNWMPKFSHLKALQSVDLSYLGLKDGQMPQLAEQLGSLSDLRELALDHNPITAEGLTLLTPALVTRRTLRALRLPYCQLDAGSAYILGTTLTSARDLHTLNLSNCHLQDSGLQHLSLALKNHTQLNRVSLRSGGYSPHGLASFLSLVSKCPRMQHLEIGECPLEEDGCDVSDKLLKAVAGSSQWNVLGLWKCGVGRTSLLERFSTLTIQLRGLTSLVLQDNDLDDDKMGHLANAVRRGVFHYLSHLNLSQNFAIKNDGVEHLAQVLPSLPHMTELLMQNSTIPPHSAVTLSRAVLLLPKMKLLDLSDGYAVDDVSSVVFEIKEIVDQGDVVVGGTVSFAERDKQMEDQYIRDKLHCLKVEPKEAAPSGVEEKEKVSTELDSSVLATGEEVRHRQTAQASGDSLLIDGMLLITLRRN